MSTAYHPQSDGQAEKANATLETFLKAYSISQLKSPEQWSQLLPLAEFTYNEAKHKAIGMSPFEAPTRFTGTRSAEAKFETRNGIRRTSRQDPTDTSRANGRGPIDNGDGSKGVSSAAPISDR